MKTWFQNSVSKIKEALFKTNQDMPFHASGEVQENIILDLTEEFFSDFFEKLIKADIGIELSEKTIKELKEQLKSIKSISQKDFKLKIKDIIKAVLKSASTEQKLNYDPLKLNIFLISGVNGSGKTTSIGKLAKRFKEDGFKVLIVAGDTFRAAASEQLNIWAGRVGVDIYSPQDIKKPDAVVFSAFEKAKKENYNLLLIDTAGRLHSQTNLMEELKKVNSIIEKNSKDAILEKLIVLDATTGQNAIPQAEFFSQAIGLTGIILSKLDSSAKGGVVLNIMNKLSIPVKVIGVGEKEEDLLDFNFDEYLEGLIS